MTRDDLINYLNNQKWINAQIELYKEQLSMAEGLKSVVIDGMPKAHNKPNYILENLLDRYNEILTYLDKLQEKQNEIVLELGNMTNSTYRLILFYKYIKGMTLEAISVELDKDYKYICNLHGYALNEFDKNFSKVEK